MLMVFATSNNKGFAFSLAAEYLLDKRKPEVLQCMSHSDFIFCNKEEALSCVKYLSGELEIKEDVTSLMEIS